MLTQTQSLNSPNNHTQRPSQLHIKNHNSPSTPKHLHSQENTSQNASPRNIKDINHQCNNPILSTPKTNDKTNQKHCITPKSKLFQEQEEEAKTQIASPNNPITIKPSLYSIECHNLLYDYSKSKEYKEDNNTYTQLQENLQPHSSSSIAEEKYSEYERLLLYQRAHLIVPIEKKDDEKYKIISTTKMKRKSAPLFKSAKKNSDFKPCYQDRFNTSIEYSSIKNKKKVHSTRKTFFTYFPLYPLYSKENTPDQATDFPLFLDKDIGIYEYWQEHIIESRADEDIITDNEQLSIAQSYILNELRHGLHKFKQEGFDQVSNNSYRNKA